ncbi:unnamed protein product [Victoria cruziana]
MWGAAGRRPVSVSGGSSPSASSASFSGSFHEAAVRVYLRVRVIVGVKFVRRFSQESGFEELTACIGLLCFQYDRKRLQELSE